MTTTGKTFKEQKDLKELHDSWRVNREGKRAKAERGGHRNLLKEAELEEQELLDVDPK